MVEPIRIFGDSSNTSMNFKFLISLSVLLTMATSCVKEKRADVSVQILVSGEKTGDGEIKLAPGIKDIFIVKPLKKDGAEGWEIFLSNQGNETPDILSGSLVTSEGTEISFSMSKPYWRTRAVYKILGDGKIEESFVIFGGL